MRKLLFVLPLLLTACGTTQPESAPRPEQELEPVVPEAGPIGTTPRTATLPTEENCPGFFEAFSEEHPRHDGRELERGPITLEEGETLAYTSRDELRNEHLVHLAGVEHLEVVLIWGVPGLTHEGLRHFPKDRIRNLAIMGKICSPGAIDILGTWTNLDHLYLHEYLPELQDVDLAPLQNTKLTSLSINQCWGLDGSFLQYLPASLKSLGVFQAYNLNGDEHLTRMDAAMLSHLPELPRLEILALMQIEFTEPLDLSPLSEFDSITNLIISRCEPFLDWDAEDGRALAGMSSLKALDLTWSGLTDENVEPALGGLDLEKLDINSNEVGSGLVPVLRQMQALKAVNIAWTGCDVDVLDALAQLPRIETIYLRTTQYEGISESELQEFGQKHPNIQIELETD